MIKKLTGFTRLSKSSHGDDVCYFLFCGFIQKFYDEVKQGKNTDENCAKTVAAIRGTTEFFTSFAKTGYEFGRFSFLFKRNRNLKMNIKIFQHSNV